MEIRATHTTSDGEMFPIIYRDVDSVNDLAAKTIHAVHAFCFYDDKLVVVYDAKKNSWAPPGGRVEIGEDISEAVRREVKEESNMRVYAQQPIGYQEVVGSSGTVVQVRVVCLVDPYGPFEGDPDGDVKKVALIDPYEYRCYFDWADIGEHLMKRALELRLEMT